jgi:ribonuclease P protein component
VQRLKTRAQYEAAMAGGTVSRTPHFVLHRAPLAAPSDSSQAPKKPSGATGAVAVPAEGPGAAAGRALFAICDEPWVGVVVPKRWAKRAVTRNGIRRQIYNVSAAFASRLPAAAHVVRLRMEFARAEFPSAWSEPLKAAVRGELQALFEKAAA